MGRPIGLQCPCKSFTRQEVRGASDSTDVGGLLRGLPYRPNVTTSGRGKCSVLTGKPGRARANMRLLLAARCVHNQLAQLQSALPPRTCMRGMLQPPMPGAPGGAGAGWRVASAVLYADQPVLMTDGQADAVIRVGNYKKNFAVKESQTLNWSTLPAGQDISVRMSGLVWPEAAQRIANSAYLTRERVGKGQIILFSGQPNFRGSTLGTNRFWLNAVVYGAGLGTSANVSL